MELVLLGIIAASVLAMAIGQVVAVTMAARTVRRVGESIGRIEDTLRPIVANVQKMSEDAARAAAIATAQVERADQLMTDVTRRVDETLTMVQDTILAPARNGIAVLQGVRAMLSAFFERGPRARPTHGPSPAAAEDDASFIG
jgi:hypothetical protein